MRTGRYVLTAHDLRLDVPHELFGNVLPFLRVMVRVPILDSFDQFLGGTGTVLFHEYGMHLPSVVLVTE